MRLWLKEQNLHQVKKGQSIGLSLGIWCQEQDLEKDTLKENLKPFLDEEDLLIALPVTEKEADAMIRQAQRFYHLASDIVVQVPATLEGLQTIQRLHRLGIPAIATQIVSLKQAFLAIHADAEALCISCASCQQGNLLWELVDNIQALKASQTEPLSLYLDEVVDVPTLLEAACKGFEAVVAESVCLNALLEEESHVATTKILG